MMATMMVIERTTWTNAKGQGGGGVGSYSGVREMLITTNPYSLRPQLHPSVLDRARNIYLGRNQRRTGRIAGL